MEKTKYKVEYYDEEDSIWIEAGLDMCHGDVLCEDCKEDKSHIDDCDYIHYETECKQIAEDKMASLLLEYNEDQVRIKEVSLLSSHN